MPSSCQNCQRNLVWKRLGQVHGKKMLPETIIYKISETNSSFYVNSALGEKFKGKAKENLVRHQKVSKYYENDCSWD